MIHAVLNTYREAFAGLPERVWRVAFVTLIHRSGTMVLPFFAIYVTTQLGLEARTAGVFLSLYGIGSVFGAMVGGRLADRLGNGRAMQITLVGGGLGFAALGFITTPWLLGCTLLLTGAAAEGFRTPSSAEIGRAAPAGLRPRAFALRRLAINIGMTLGPAIGGFLATIHYGWLFAVDSATCFGAAAAAALLLRAGPIRSESDDATRTAVAVDGRRLWKSRRLAAALLCAAILTLAFAQLFSAFPLTLKQDYGYSEALIGSVLALNTLLIIAFEMVLQHRLAAVRPPAVAAIGCATLAIGYLLIPLGPALSIVVVALVVMTVGEMLTYPVIDSYVVGLVPETAMSRAVGLLNAVFAATFVLAPLAGMALYDAQGYVALWIATAGVSAVAALGFLILGTRTQTP